MDLKSNGKNNYENQGRKVVGHDWSGQELYGFEFGFMLDGEFVCEDDIIDFMEEKYGMVLSSDVIEELK